MPPSSRREASRQGKRDKKSDKKRQGISTLYSQYCLWFDEAGEHAKLTLSATASSGEGGGADGEENPEHLERSIDGSRQGIALSSADNHVTGNNETVSLTHGVWQPLHSIEREILINLKETEPADADARVKEALPSFSSYYLKKITGTFADDLDKIRAAGDFSDATLPLMVLALEQGTECFTAEERQKIEAAMSQQN